MTKILFKDVPTEIFPLRGSKKDNYKNNELREKFIVSVLTSKNNTEYSVIKKSLRDVFILNGLEFISIQKKGGQKNIDYIITFLCLNSGKKLIKKIDFKFNCKNIRN